MLLHGSRVLANDFKKAVERYRETQEQESNAAEHERYKISVLSRKRICHGTVIVTCTYIEDI